MREINLMCNYVIFERSWSDNFHLKSAVLLLGFDLAAKTIPYSNKGIKQKNVPQRCLDGGYVMYNPVHFTRLFCTTLYTIYD